MEERLQRLKEKTLMSQSAYQNQPEDNPSYYDNMSQNTKNTNEDTGSLINYREMDGMGNSGMGFNKIPQHAR